MRLTPTITNRNWRRRNQRGTAYVLVLSITSMLVILGLAATQLAKGGRQRNTLQEDQIKARLAAEYAQDYIHKVIDGSGTWRNGAVNGAWNYFADLDGTKIYYAYVDESDGRVWGDYTQPFRLYTYAIRGDASRLYSVEYIPDESKNLTRNPSTWRRETLAD